MKKPDGTDYGLCETTDSYSAYGPGVKLFFDFIRDHALIFWIMAIVSIPALYSNISGNGLAVNYQ